MTKSIAAAIALAVAPAVFADNTYKLFNATSTQPSPMATALANAQPFGTTTLPLYCPAVPSAVLAGAADGTTGLYVDNFVTVNDQNVCIGGAGTQFYGVEHCFAFPVYTPIQAVNISGRFTAGQQQATFKMIDFGGTYGSSEVWLVTNCEINGDNDGDSVTDRFDNCPGDANANQLDSDGDAQGDVCDACPLDVLNDVDGDGFCSDQDNCPAQPNASQADADDDDIGDVCDFDSDNDGVVDSEDNCQLTANPGQADGDGDGSGDACDSDDDNDAVVDSSDKCPGTAPGAFVNTEGCSTEQLCVCEASWKNHGGYVSCVARAAESLLSSGVIEEAQKDLICSAAGMSSCGAKK